MRPVVRRTAEGVTCTTSVTRRGVPGPVPTKRPEERPRCQTPPPRPSASARCPGSRARTCSSPAAAPASARRSPCVRRVRRQRRDQLPAPARGGARHRGAGAGLRHTRSSRRASATCSSAATSPTRTTSCAWSATRSRRSAASTCWSTTPASRSRGPAHELSSADFDKVLAVNLRGVVPVRARGDQALPRPRTSRASIVNVSSVHQLIPKPDYLGYSVSKGGMQNLTRTLALEYAGAGHPRQRRSARARRSRRSTAPGSTTRSSASRSRSTSRCARAGDADEMAGVDLLPRQRRRRLHHRPDDLRRRRPDPLPELPRALVVGMHRRRWWPSPFGRTTSSACSTTSTTPSAARRWPSSARAGMYDLGHVLDETRPGVPGPLLPPDARHHRPPRQRAAAVGENQVNWITELVSGTHAARHPPRRAQPSADRRPRLQRLDASRELAGTAGVTRLGVETVPQIVTRGWLVDVAGLRRRAT